MRATPPASSPHLVSEGGEMAGVLSFVAAGLGAAVVPDIALPADGSLVGIPFVGPELSRTVALAQRGDRTLARPARALADQLPAGFSDATATPARRKPRRRAERPRGDAGTLRTASEPRTGRRRCHVSPAGSGQRRVNPQPSGFRLRPWLALLPSIPPRRRPRAA